MINVKKHDDLQNIITDVFNYAYTHSEIRIPATTCKEVGKILHVGLYIEEVESKIPAFCFEAEDLRHLNGNNNPFSKHLALTIRQQYHDMNRKWKIYDDEILFGDKDISYICGKLNNVYISNPDKDVFGDALEIFRSRWAKQEGGQFFTDQQVTALAMSLLDFDPTRGDDLIDICAGTGGFLLAGFNHIRSIVEKRSGDEGDVIKLAAKSLKGIEIDKEVCSLGNSTLSARTGKHAKTFISQANSLDRDSFKRADISVKIGGHTCAATNPPFGAKIAIKDYSILSQYELSQTGNSEQSLLFGGAKSYGRAPDVLFIEQNLKILKPEKGRLAIVVPYQILSGPQTRYVRNWIIKNAQIEAVIDLPSETFQPHTGTKTSLILLRKRKEPLKDFDHSDLKNEKIFMSSPRWIGHDRRGKPIYKKNSLGHHTNELLSDIPDVEQAFLAYRQGKKFENIHAGSFFIKMADVLKDDLLRINAQYHAPMYVGVNKISKKNARDWEVKKIGDLVKDIFYPGRFRRDYVDEYPGAVPFLGGSNITELIVKTDKWLSHTDPKLEQLRISEGWLLVTRSGSTGIVSSVPKAWHGFAMSEHVIRIVPDRDKIDPMYILAFLKTKICQAEMAKGIFGSVIDEITPETIKNIEMPIPKDDKLFSRICAQVKKSEQAKQIALENLYSSISDLDRLLLSDETFGLAA